MSWDPAWEAVFSSRAWGRYPPEELIRFAAHHLYPLRGREPVEVLELGCGGGANLWYLAREGISAVGLDGSAAAVEQARTRLEEESVAADVVEGDVTAIGELFAGCRFHAVIDVNCLQHNDPAAAEETVATVQRLLRPGGRLFSMLVGRGSFGDGLGREVSPGTYVDIHHGPLAGVGLTHFWSLEEVERLVDGFASAAIEWTERTLDGRRRVYGHWIVDAAVVA